MTSSSAPEHPPFAVFRARDACDCTDEDYTTAPMSDVASDGMARLFENGFADGGKVKMLYSRPGMTLTYCWFKNGYPLPLHSHDTDCLYFIIAGSLKVGTEELGPGDGFFVGGDVPYSYQPGDQGVEVLEFRTKDHFDFKVLANSTNYWNKALAGMLAAKPRWAAEQTALSGIEVG